MVAVQGGCPISVTTACILGVFRLLYVFTGVSIRNLAAFHVWL